MGNYVLAADFGTSSLKLGLFDDRCRLTCLAPQRYHYPTFSRKPGWVEQSPHDWWQVFKEAVRDILRKHKIKNDEIVCVNVGAHMGIVCVDKSGVPLRDAILFFDQRAIKQCDQIKKIVDEKEVEDICGNRVSTVQTATQILWLRQNEPKTYNHTEKFLVAPGYISFLLTGQHSYDFTHASWSLLFDIRRRTWSEELFQTLNIDQDKFPDAMPSWSLLGYVTEESADETGLKAGTPVMVGGSDTPLAALAEKVIERDHAMMTAGSVSSVITCTDEAKFSTVLLNRCHVIPDRWLIQGAMNAHSNVFEWLIRELYPTLQSQRMSKKENIFNVVEKEIKRSPPGSNGLIFLPYLAGERSPIWDPYARGVIFGLTFNHKRGDIMRSAYEGITYAARQNLEAIEGAGMRIDELKIVGGGAKSVTWNQIKADILEK
ncbi:MAG: xylulokinase, partial [Nitrososphaeria archaeon]